MHGAQGVLTKGRSRAVNPALAKTSMLTWGWGLGPRSLEPPLGLTAPHPWGPFPAFFLAEPLPLLLMAQLCDRARPGPPGPWLLPGLPRAHRHALFPGSVCGWGCCLGPSLRGGRRGELLPRVVGAAA